MCIVIDDCCMSVHRCQYNSRYFFDKYCPYVMTLGGDKVSVLTHTYPHKPLRKIKVTI